MLKSPRDLGALQKFSDDGQYFWDGGEWRTAFSADRKWRWTGTEWVAASSPVTSPTNRRLQLLASIAAAFAGLLLLVSVIALAGAASEHDSSAWAGVGVGLILLSFAIALAAPLTIRYALRRGAFVVTVIVLSGLFLGTCGSGTALLAAFPVPTASPSPRSPDVALQSTPGQQSSQGVSP